MFAEFTRACKAAARAVALYPGAIRRSARRFPDWLESAQRLADNAPFTLQVRANSLLLGGAAPQRPDPAIGELAEVLYRHMIGALTVNAAADANSWRTLLLLLARAPEEVRGDGGIARLWATAGRPQPRYRRDRLRRGAAREAGRSRDDRPDHRSGDRGTAGSTRRCGAASAPDDHRRPGKISATHDPTRIRNRSRRHRGEDRGVSESGPKPDRVPRQDEPAISSTACSSRWAKRPPASPSTAWSHS